MKKLIIISAIALSSLVAKQADAQLGVHVSFHFGTRPVYVPAPQPEVIVANDNYDNDDDYYYLPDVEAYYNVRAHCYYYNDGARWISAAYLPGRYHDYDWRTARRYEIHSSRPFMRHDEYRTRFGGFGNNGGYGRGYGDYGRNHDDHGDNRGWGGRDEQRYDNRGQGGQYRNNDHQDNRQGGYGQQNQGRGQGGYGQQNQDRGQGGYGQQNQDRGQGSYGQPNQGQPSNQNRGGQQGGGYGQQGQGQPSNQNHGGQQGQDHGQGGGSQPANQNRGGSNDGGQHYTANRTGVVNDRGQEMGRPVRF